MSTLRELQDLYSQNNLGTFQYYTAAEGTSNAGQNFLYIPGIGGQGAQGNYFTTDQATIDSLDKASLEFGGGQPSFSSQVPRGWIEEGIWSPSKSGSIDYLNNYFTQTNQLLQKRADEQRFATENAALPQDTSGGYNEATATAARNALLPEGVQPGQAFGQPLANQPYQDPNASGVTQAIYRDNQNNFYAVNADGSRRKLTEQEAFAG